jgi:hypothetical protein
MNFTQNNHLYYTIGGRRFGQRQTPYEKFEVFVGPVDRDVYRTSSWQEELRKTASGVLGDMGKDLILFLSGGTDSEIVLRNFIEIGFKPHCVAIKFKDDYNAADIIEAAEIARCTGVKLEIVECDIKDFYLSGEAGELSQELYCSQIAYLNVYNHIKKLGAPSVMGGEQLLRRLATPTENYWYDCFRENQDASAMRFSIKYNIPVVNEWFSYTPEMMLYYLEQPDVQQIIRDNVAESTAQEKNVILQRLYPAVRKKIKTHGFEQLIDFNIEVTNKLKSRMIPRITPSLDGISITRIMQMFRGDQC